MSLRQRLHASLHPPEPVRSLSAALVQAARQLGPLPRWVERYPLSAMSPGARQVAWAVGRHITHNPDHGFAIAERVPPGALGSLGELYEVSASLAVVHGYYDQLSALVLEHCQISIAVGDASVTLAFQPEPSLATDRAEEDFRAAMQVRLWRNLLREPALAPIAVHFTYARPTSTQCHSRLLGTQQLRFAQPCLQIELARKWWDTELPGHDPALFEQRYGALCELARAQEREGLEVTVEGMLMGLMSRDPTAQSVASALGLSARSLRRKLAEGGETLRAIAERARQREAALLAEIDALPGAPVLPSTQRARLLGFANPGALRNALRRWRAGAGRI